MLRSVKPSTRKHKRFLATFKDGTQTHFGLKGGATYIDHGDKQKRDAYRARHKTDLKTNNPQRAGYLSYYVLWGNSKNIKQNIREFNKQFF